jgi:hypothetical protein
MRFVLAIKGTKFLATYLVFGYWSTIERFFGDIKPEIRRFWNGFIGNYS